MPSNPASAYHATDGAAYHVFLGRWTERLADATLDALELPDDGAVLDVGCGTGSLALAMATTLAASSGERRRCCGALHHVCALACGVGASDF